MSSLFHDEDETKAFLTKLQEQHSNTTPYYYVQVATRKKYGGISDEILFRKLVKAEHLIDELHQATPLRGFYRRGQRIAPETIVCYMTPEPRNVERATKQVVASYILKQPEEEFRISSKFLSECQKCSAERNLLDIDIDDREMYPLVMDALENMMLVPALSIQTRGGYHLLCKDPTNQQCNQLHALCKLHKGRVELLKNALVPIPGTWQGGFAVKYVE